MSRLIVATAALLSCGCRPIPVPVASDESVVEQQEAYWRQLTESERLLERQKAMMDAGEEILRRQRALVELQEQQAQRFNAVLDKWEAPQPR